MWNPSGRSGLRKSSGEWETRIPKRRGREGGYNWRSGAARHVHHLDDCLVSREKEETWSKVTNGDYRSKTRESPGKMHISPNRERIVIAVSEGDQLLHIL